MSGAGFILAINLSVAGFLSAAFMAIAVYDRTRTAAPWFAASYLAGAAYFALEFAIPFSGGHPLVTVGSYASFLVTLGIFNVAIARLYDVVVPWRLMAVVFVFGVALRIGIADMPREELSRQFLYQFPYFAMQAVGVWILARNRRNGRLENLLFGLLCASALHFLAKPLIARASGGVGGSSSAYIDTAYAMFSQSLGTILAMAVALLLFVILMRDLLTLITQESVTDNLSGLLNRRGFEDLRDRAIRNRARNGIPVSIVLCDIDRFKDINDTYGHATGDLVIVAFSDLLRSVMAAHHAGGRIGGEEFAVLIEGANLTSARLFAEHARQAFSAMQIEGLPPHRRVTASFGIAEALDGETALQLQARADQALYEAKRAGRDCVRISSPPRIGAAGPSLRLI